ncbi:myosin heavy chain, clone 203-like [Macrobrachium rosenbergii]|uniref:myosin heavy chain, clone 203-like n=1 Tax=Macrobrachium rosenbergii TaxID=79674 RepID=UPI0034D77AAA
MFAFYVSLCVLAFVACDLFDSIVGDLMMLKRAEGPLSKSQDLYFITVESVNPGHVEEQKNFWTPGFAVAITCVGLALLAGLAVTAYRKYQRHGKYVHGLEEDLKRQRTEISILRDRLETEEKRNVEKDKELEKMNHDMQLLRQERGQLDAATKRLEEALERNKIHESKMESLLNGANEENESLRNQIVDRDRSIGRNAEERRKITTRFEEEKKERDRKIKNLEQARDHLLADQLRLEESLMQALEREKRLENHLDETNRLLTKKDKDEKETCNRFQESLIKKVRDLESALREGTELDFRLKETEAYNEVLVSESDCFKIVNDHLRETLTEKEREIDHLKNLKEVSVQEVAGLRERNCDLEQQLEKIKEVKALNDQEINSLKNSLENGEERSRIITEEVQQMRNWVAELGGQNSKMEDEKRILNEELQQMRNWVAELGGQNAKMEEELTGKQQEIQSLKNSLIKEEEGKSILNEEVQQMRNWVAELGGQNAKLEEEIAVKNQKINSLKNSLENLNAEVQLVRNWAVKVESEKADINLELAARNQEITSLKNYLENEGETKKIMNEELEQMKKRLAELEGINSNIKDELIKKDEMITSMANALENEKENNKILREKLGKQVVKLDSILALLMQATDHIQDSDKESNEGTSPSAEVGDSEKPSSDAELKEFNKEG